MLSIRLGAVTVCRAGWTQLCFGQGWLQGFAAGIVFRGQSPAALGPAPCPGVVLWEGMLWGVLCTEGVAVPRCHRDTE